MIEDIRFLSVEEVVAIHADEIDRYGGDSGLRDRGLLESAVYAAQNVAAYVEHWDLFDLAAAYIFHLPRTSPSSTGTSARPWRAVSSSSIKTVSKSTI